MGARPPGPLHDCLIWAGLVRSSRGLSLTQPLSRGLSYGAAFTRKCCVQLAVFERPEPARGPPPHLHRPATAAEAGGGVPSLLYFVPPTTEDNKASIFGREGSVGALLGL